jgi:hypothetical protein
MIKDQTGEWTMIVIFMNKRNKIQLIFATFLKMAYRSNKGYFVQTWMENELEGEAKSSCIGFGFCFRLLPYEKIKVKLCGYDRVRPFLCFGFKPLLLKNKNKIKKFFSRR